MPARRSHPDHQSICSPYMLGVSPRTKASNVLFRTADQSRSRLSSATLSIHSPSSSTAPAVVRAIRSPLANRGPRSGQCRFGSKGCHLKAIVSPPAAGERTVVLPEIVEVVRKRTLEEAVESHSLWCRTVLSGGVEEVTKPKVPHMSKCKVPHRKCRLTLGSMVGEVGLSGKTRYLTKPRRRVHRVASIEALPSTNPWYTSIPSLDGNPTRSSKPS